jgi:hypothetical protein
MDVLMEVIRWLRESGLRVKDCAESGIERAGVVLDVATGEQGARFVAEWKSRAPYPHEVERLHRTWQELALRGHPLLTAPFISESLGTMLTGIGWSWADDQGNFDLRAPGLVLRQRRTTIPPVSRRTTLPSGSGSLAIIRFLVGSGTAGAVPGVTELARVAGVSQPRASQVLRQLRGLGLAESTSRGRWEPRREELLDRFLAEYPGPGGSESYFYGLDSPVETAVRAAGVDGLGQPVVVSADVGPDLIAPWRRPTVVILYASRVIDPSALGLVSAQGPHDANVIVRMPADHSVFPPHRLMAQVKGRDVLLADPLQQIWDLEDLGGDDRTEAAGRLREWLLTHP